MLLFSIWIRCQFIVTGLRDGTLRHYRLYVERGGSDQLQASVAFSVSSNHLQVLLSNISTCDVVNPSQVLTAVFFDFFGTATLEPVSASLTPDSIVLNGPDGDGNVGGEWAYGTSLSGAPGGCGFWHITFRI